jgi:hypothetical protein
MPKDVNQIAKAVVDMATAEPAPEPAADQSPPVELTPAGKNPAAVALGKLGGAKGGPAGEPDSTDHGRFAGLRRSG